MNLRTLSIVVLSLLAAQVSGFATDFQIEKIVDEGLTKAKAEEAVPPVKVPKQELSDSQTDDLNPAPTPPQKTETTDDDKTTHQEN